jgi:hypothetical protein
LHCYFPTPVRSPAMEITSRYTASRGIAGSGGTRTSDIALGPESCEREWSNILSPSRCGRMPASERYRCVTVLGPHRCRLPDRVGPKQKERPTASSSGHVRVKLSRGADPIAAAGPPPYETALAGVTNAPPTEEVRATTGRRQCQFRCNSP